MIFICLNAYISWLQYHFVRVKQSRTLHCGQFHLVTLTLQVNSTTSALKITDNTPGHNVCENIRLSKMHKVTHEMNNNL